jgi:hypothetical protein
VQALFHPKFKIQISAFIEPSQFSPAASHSGLFQSEYIHTPVGFQINRPPGKEIHFPGTHDPSKPREYRFACASLIAGGSSV